MKICPTCGNQVNDNEMFCTNCGTQLSQQQPYNQYQYQAPVDPYDHTAEFDAKDISDNKVISMLIYLMGAVGIIIALLASNSSNYVSFHVRQSLKILVVEILGGICAALLCWTFIVPIAYAVLVIALIVVRIMCFFQICSGKAKEPAIIRKLDFLK